VAHIYNPSYLGERDQEDQGLRPARANSLQNPFLKIPNIKMAGGVAQMIECLPSKYKGSESKPQHHKKRKKNTPKVINSTVTKVSKVGSALFCFFSLHKFIKIVGLIFCSRASIQLPFKDQAAMLAAALAVVRVIMVFLLFSNYELYVI
jgi:hypothetical protein